MTNLNKLFNSFSNKGNIYLNRNNEVIFEIKYKELEFNYAKISYDESLNYDSPEKAPIRFTKWVKKTHEAYFRYHEEKLQCKVLEWLSRAAFKEGNDEVSKWYLEGINKFLGTKFSHKDIEEIYCHLGNSVNRGLTLKFINSNYDIEVLSNVK